MAELQVCRDQGTRSAIPTDLALPRPYRRPLQPIDYRFERHPQFSDSLLKRRRFVAIEIVEMNFRKNVCCFVSAALYATRGTTVDKLTRFPQQEDAAQHQLSDALGVGLRIGQRQGRAPRSPKQLPALDAEVGAQLLHVGDEVPGGCWHPGWRAAASGRSRAGRTARCDGAGGSW